MGEKTIGGEKKSKTRGRAPEVEKPTNCPWVSKDDMHID